MIMAGLAATAWGGEYFVAPTGSDTNPGTKASPFRTIQKAATVMSAGDRCLIRAGTYRETVTPPRSGKKGAPIVFEAYNDERVVISGCDLINGPWTQHEGSIFTAPMSWTLGPGKDMVFVDGIVVIQARHPNTHTTQAKAPDSRTPNRPPPIGLPPLWMTYGDFRVTRGSSTITNPTDLNQEQKDYWKGAIYAGWHGWGWCMQTARVTGSEKGAITVDKKTGQWWFPDSSKRYTEKFAWNNQGYLTQHIHALDKPGEWHVENGRLYLWPPDRYEQQSAPVVEAKRRHLAFDLRGRQYIHLKGLRIKASSLSLYNADDCVIDGCRMSFVSHFTMFDDGRDGYIDDFRVQDKNGAPQRGEVGIYVGGRNNVVKNSVIKYSAGAGLFLAGHATTVTNNIIHDCGYGGTYMGPIFISYDPESKERDARGVRGGHTITYNHIYRASRALIHTTSILPAGKQGEPTRYDAMDIGYNRLHDASIVGLDSGSIYCWSARLGDQKGERTQWHHNLVWDNWSKTWGALVYPDNWAFGLDIHHNVLWTTRPAKNTEFYKHNPPGDHNYFKNKEMRSFRIENKRVDNSFYPGGKYFRTGPTIKDENDRWYP